MPSKEFTILLNVGARIIVYFFYKKNNIIKFVVKLEVLINDKWIEVERYDTHHGCVHKDILDKNGYKKRVQKYKLVGIKAGLNVAINDFKENHELYIWRFLNG